MKPQTLTKLRTLGQLRHRSVASLNVILLAAKTCIAKTILTQLSTILTCKGQTYANPFRQSATFVNLHSRETNKATFIGPTRILQFCDRRIFCRSPAVTETVFICFTFLFW